MFANVIVAAASATMTFLASRRLKSNEDGETPSASASKKENTTIDFPPFLAQREREKGSPKQCYCQLCPDSPSDGTLENKENFGIDSPPKKKPNPLSKEKRERYLSWDDYFMTVAFLSSQRSKDPNKQVGAVIASEENLILGVGYNGFPRGCGDDALPWAKKSPTNDPLETKYAYVCHAEMNAIMNKNSADVKNGTMYVTMYPCNECAKLMIQAGIREVVYCEGKLKNDASSASSSSSSKEKKKKALGENTNNEAPTSGVAVEKKEEKKVDPSYFASQKLLALAGITVRKYEPKVKVDLTYLRD